MKVWVVTQYDPYDRNTWVVNVFSSEQIARKYMTSDCEVEEFEVQE